VHFTRQKAIEAPNSKSNFLSTMSHEIRTPLNSVIGLYHILGDNNAYNNQMENINALNYTRKENITQFNK
jgi:signal transduction histidine kinase